MSPVKPQSLLGRNCYTGRVAIVSVIICPNVCAGERKAVPVQ